VVVPATWEAEVENCTLTPAQAKKKGIKKILSQRNKSGLVVQGCGTSYVGGRDRTVVRGQKITKKTKKRIGCGSSSRTLASKYKALSSKL
jgi:hypothetical protein